MARPIVKGLNISNQTNWEVEGVEFQDCNITQTEPWANKKYKNCKFTRCNLTNNDIDGTNEIEDCNITQVKKTVLPNGKIKREFFDMKTRVKKAETIEDKEE